MKFEYIEFEMIVGHPHGELAVEYIPRLGFRFRSPKHMSSITTNKAWRRRIITTILGPNDRRWEIVVSKKGQNLIDY